MIGSLHRLLVSLVLLPVVLYRRVGFVVLWPIKRGMPTCIYLPTCSEYAIEAVKTRGIVVGVALSVARVLRCNPLCHGGHDPVPPKPDAHRCAHKTQEQH